MQKYKNNEAEEISQNLSEIWQQWPHYHSMVQF